MNSLFFETCSETMIFPTAPFNFDGTVHKPDYFPSTDNAYAVGYYWQTVRFGEELYGTKLTNEGSLYSPAIRLSVYSERPIKTETLMNLKEEIEYRFDLKADLSKFYEQFSNDLLLAPVLERWIGMRDSTNVSLYEFLVIATVLQNTTVRRSVQMMETLFKYYGTQISFDDKVLSAFWPPIIIHGEKEETLRALKFGYRAKTLLRQSEIFVNGKMDERILRSLATDQLKEKLLEIYGIGPASVWYLLFQVFKRYDAFEYVSPWEQKIFSQLIYGEELVDSKTLLNDAEKRWGPWKMLALHYLFEDLFWKHEKDPVSWLSPLIHL